MTTRTWAYLDLLLVEPNRRLSSRHNAVSGPVNVAQDHEQAALLEGTAQQTGILQILEGDVPVTLEPEVHEVEVLRDDRVRWTREVERERVLDRPEVVQLEDEVLRKVSLVPPDDPADTDVGKTEFVA